MNQQKNNKRVDFELPGDASVIGVMYEILEANGLSRRNDPATWPDESEESQVSIITNAAIAIFKNMAPEEKLIALLAKHLHVKKETAERVVADIKRKLIPYAKEVSRREIPLEGKMPTVKKVAVREVEKNAEELRKKRVPSTQKDTIEEQLERKEQPDSYRETVE